MKYLRKHAVAIIVLFLVVALSIGSFFIDLDEFHTYIEQAGIWAPVFYILIKSSTVIFAPLSGTALYIFSVPLFGFWPALLYSFLGDLLGATVTFFIAQKYGKPVVMYFLGKKNLKYLNGALSLMSTQKGFFVLRLATITTPEIASYAAGLSTLKFRDFIFIHMFVDAFPIVTLSAIGLIFTEQIPAGLMVFGIIFMLAVTLVSTLFFGYLVHKHSNKTSSLNLLQK